MDTIDTTSTDAVIIDTDGEVVDHQNPSFAQELAKTFAISAATTVASVAGFVAIGYAYEKFSQFKTRRAAKKNDDVVEGEIDGDIIVTSEN